MSGAEDHVGVVAALVEVLAEWGNAHTAGWEVLRWGTEEIHHPPSPFWGPGKLCRGSKDSTEPEG